MKNKTVVICLVVSLVMLGATLVFHQPARAAGEVTKIGIFDLQRAINNSKKGQAAKAQLVTKFERLQKELKAREAELERLQKALQNQTSMLSPEAKYEKEKDLKRKIRDFQDQYRDYTEEMKKEEFERTKPIINEVLKIAVEYAKEKGFSLVLEAQKAGVVYVPKSMDITEEVIKRFDRK